MIFRLKCLQLLKQPFFIIYSYVVITFLLLLVVSFSSLILIFQRSNSIKLNIKDSYLRCNKEYSKEFFQLGLKLAMECN